MVKPAMETPMLPETTSVGAALPAWETSVSSVIRLVSAVTSRFLFLVKRAILKFSTELNNVFS